jgi:hypothetical protein
MIRFLLTSAALMVLAGCGELDQSTASSQSNRNDTPPWQGVKNPYAVQGWTAGDKTSWETQLRTRSQAQNEYVKVN